MKNIFLLFSITVFLFSTGFSQNCELTCISKVNASLKPNECTATLNPYYFITNPSDISPSCMAYQLKFEYPFGTTTYSPATKLDLSHQGYSFTYKVIDSVSKNSCWGTIKVNYCNPCLIKTPPVMTSFTASAGPYIPGSTITLYASATDDKSISKVEFYNLGTLIGTDYSASYSTTYKFDSVYASVNSFKAIAYDNCGDTAQSVIVKITTTFPTCTDGYQNGTETGKDCGGGCAIACPVSCADKMPINLSASVYGSSVTLNWTGTVEQYYLEIENTATGQTVVTDPYATKPYVISLIDGNYRYRVKSRCGYELSAWSTWKYFTIDDYHPICYGPSILSSTVSGSIVTLSWTGSAAQYHLEIKNTSTNAIVLSDLHATSPYITTLPDGYYTFRVKSICGSWYSDWCDWVTFNIHDYHPTCYPPYNLAASVYGAIATLSWTGSLSQYHLEIKNTSTNAVVLSDLHATSPYSTTLPDGYYAFRVKNICGSIYSDWCDWVTFTIHDYHPYPMVCNTPTALTSSVIEDQVHLSWTGSAVEYQIQIEDAYSYTSKSSVHLDKLYFDINLPHGNYRWRVISICNGAYSDWSNWKTFTIDYVHSAGPPCYPPGHLTSNVVNGQVNINWSGSASSYELEVLHLETQEVKSYHVIGTYNMSMSMHKGSYKCKVKCHCGDISSAWSEWNSFIVTSDAIDTQVPCEMPYLLKSKITDQLVDLSWSGNSAVYNIEIDQVSGGIKSIALDINDPTYVTNLTNGTYKFRVNSACDQQVSDWTSWSYFTVGDNSFTAIGIDTTCAKVTGLQTIYGSDTSLTLKWNASNLSPNYTIEIESTHAPVSYRYKLEAYKDTILKISGLLPGTQYKISIHTNCGNEVISGDHSIYSITWAAKPPQDYGSSKYYCDIPLGPVVRIISSTNASYSWVGVSRSQNYTVEITSVDSTPAYSNVAKLGNVVVFQSNDLRPGGTYQFRLKADCSLSKGAYSVPIKFTMPKEPQQALILESRSIPNRFDFDLFPNPAHSRINLRFNNNVKGIKRIQITSLEGQVLLDQSKSNANMITTFNLDHYAPGIYFIKVISDQAQQVKKVIIQ